jgi:hypothetical protein
MVPRPSTIKIGPHPYAINWGKTSWKRYAPKEEADTVGRTFPRQNRILIKGWLLELSQQQDTLLHEIQHAIMRALGLANIDLGKEYDLEESIISLTTPLLLMVLKENPHVVAWLVCDE